MSRHEQRSRTRKGITIEQEVTTALHCLQRVNPHLDAKAKRKMVKAILALLQGNERPVPRSQITGAQCVELVWSNSQCIHTKTGKCPLLVFGTPGSDPCISVVRKGLVRL
jgi:hypothetical protein